MLSFLSCAEIPLVLLVYCIFALFNIFTYFTLFFSLANTTTTTGSYMGVIYCGGTGYYISPISFLKDPVVWIKAMSKFRGTHTQVSCFNK